MLRRRWSLSSKLIWCRDLIRCKFFTRKRYELEDEGEGGGWFEQLPDDIMQLILQRLPLSDYLNCRKVSRSWRAAIDSKLWLPAAHHQLPRLVTSSRLGGGVLASYIKKDDDDCLRIVSHQKIWRIKTDPPADCYCYCAGSVEGWLIITTIRSYVERWFFWNPVSGARVKLPTHHSSLRFREVKVVASSVPTTTKCYVSCLHFRQEGRLAFCTPTDKSWTLIKVEKTLQFREIEILDGKLYALGREALEFVIVFDIHLDTHAYTSQRLVNLHPNVKSIVDDGNFYRTCYLAKCCESKDLFMVILWHDGHDGPYRPNYQRSLQVLKLENNNKWVEIDDLGDRALFMARLNSKFITCHNNTLERNCIYFVLPKRYDIGYNFGVFSLTDRSFKNTLQHYDRLLWAIQPSTWFTPNPY
ncbi:hypothetical protein ACLB2K_067894 [Fragaria x ananassa]